MSLPSALSPMHVWALQAPPCTAWAVVYALLTESPNQAVANTTPQVARMILLTCITATFLNVLGMTTMKQLGASSMQIIGKLNTIILLAFSMGFWGERMPQVPDAKTVYCSKHFPIGQLALRHCWQGSSRWDMLRACWSRRL